jgi:hypothetical protein
VAKILVAALQEATQTELYDRTPLPVSRKMYRSITQRFAGQSVVVGYNGRVAPYAALRLAKKGRSRSGGHDMTMDPAKFVQRRTARKIRQLGEFAQRRILKG